MGQNTSGSRPDTAKIIYEEAKAQALFVSGPFPEEYQNTRLSEREGQRIRATEISDVLMSDILWRASSTSRLRRAGPPRGSINNLSHGVNS